MFLGKRKLPVLGEEIKEEHNMISNNKFDPKKMEKPEEFLFGVCLHLGSASNNYAEFVGLILAQIFSSMFKQTNISIYSDS